MTTSHRRILPLLIVLGLIGLGISCWRAHSSSASATTAQAILAECHQLAEQIKTARGGPTKAEENRRTQDDLAQQIEAWCRSAGIPSKSILRIEPLPSRRVGETSYLLQGSRIQLRDFTLLQLASFSEQIRTSKAKLSIDSLRLTAPRVEPTDSVADEFWQGELALTYLLYSPRSTR